MSYPLRDPHPADVQWLLTTAIPAMRHAAADATEIRGIDAVYDGLKTARDTVREHCESLEQYRINEIIEAIDHAELTVDVLEPAAGSTYAPYNGRVRDPWDVIEQVCRAWLRQHGAQRRSPLRA